MKFLAHILVGQETQEAELWHAASFFFFFFFFGLGFQPTLMVLSTFRVGLPGSMNAFWRHFPHTHGNVSH